MHQPDICRLFRLAGAYGSEKHLKPGQIGFVEGSQDLDTVRLPVLCAVDRICRNVALLHFIHLNITPLNSAFHTCRLDQKSDPRDDQIGGEDIVQRQRRDKGQQQKYDRKDDVEHAAECGAPGVRDAEVPES